MSNYRSFKLSEESWPEAVRALWMAGVKNRRDGIEPAKPEAAEKEAWGRILREWSAMTVHEVCHEPDFMPLVRADWRCSCGSSGLGKGGLIATVRGVLCRPCNDTNRQAIVAPEGS
tara:strand:+ start:1434 stop:1781 length:348 start_codon:yes stop_codon:yes gene_type:complete